MDPKNPIASKTVSIQQNLSNGRQWQLATATSLCRAKHTSYWVDGPDGREPIANYEFRTTSAMWDEQQNVDTVTYLCLNLHFSLILVFLSLIRTREPRRRAKQ